MAHLVHQYLSETAGRDPSRTALIAGDVRRSFAELDRESDAIACALQSAGIARGDRVAVMLENSIDYVAGLFGTLNYPWLVPVTGAATEQAIEIIAKAFNEREAMRENIAENRPRVEALQENYREHLRNLFRRIVERKRAA